MMFSSTASQVAHSSFTEFPEQHRLYMCREAYQEIRRLKEINIEVVTNSKPGRSEYYRVHFRTERSKDVVAFKCPTNPSIYLSLVDQRTSESSEVWIIIEETELSFLQLNIIRYEVKIFQNIAEGNTYRPLSWQW